ncbi:hypothetical protein LTR62_001388 [Meristemomyces frigidus]|uniref:Uncharacterized protein n=1 Tax=Meristemomyces frigidus TaxID=1508187 RepID=A0AAN7YBJ6_9PEZI|nr:hypothetical protein LTR62_001388 [Meristemomyces frigidus]
MPSPHEDYYSTAYHGSQGHLDEQSMLSVDLDRDDYDNLQQPEPCKTASPIRPALSARLMSTWSNAQPAATALSRKGSVMHSRAKSLAGFLPKLNASVPSTPGASEAVQTRPRQSVFANMFSGESAPIRLGIPQSPSKEMEESEFVMEYKPSFTERPTPPRRRISGFTPASASTTTTQTKPGWFSRKTPAPLSPPQPRDEPDPILTLNINTALFPTGVADPCDPHAFNDLLLNATSLLQRMQAAYKERVDSIAFMQPEMDAQQEEVEEAETRAEHLKLQLEELAFKSVEQNRAMEEMAAQLAAEKMKVIDLKEEVAASRTVRPVHRTSHEDSRESKDDTTPRRPKRNSAGSRDSDSGFESDAEYADSITSAGVETPVMTLTPAYDGQGWDLSSRSLGYYDYHSLHERVGSGRDVSGSTIFSAGREDGGMGRESGGAERVEGEMVRGLRRENEGLRSRVRGLEGEVQGVIELVGGVLGGR